VDHEYRDLTAEELARWDAEGYDDHALDRLRGRQVWLDHGGGVITRYAHLSAVAAGLRVGDAISAGTVIGFVGESGTPEGLYAPGTDEHLHFEIWAGDSYLGEGLSLEEARALYLAAFGLSQ
jgi:murein DD-endopeptidase MepM/ murein hydrolase activator NlpD